MTLTRCSLLSLGSVGWLTACGATASAPPRAMYSAEQLNGFASQPPLEEIAGASDPNARPFVAVAPEPAPPPPPARLRVIHASPDPAASPVAISLDDASSPAIASLAYKSAAGYAELPSGVHSLQVRAASASASTPPALSGSSPELSSGAAYTVIAYGPGPAGTPALGLSAAPDSSPEPDAGHAHLRFFHALVGLGSVDVCLPGATASAPATQVFGDVVFGAFGRSDGPAHTYVGITTEAPVTLQIRLHHTTTCRGRVIGHGVLTVPERSVRTLVAVGRLASAGNPAVPSEVLACTDAYGTVAPSSECSTVPLAAGPMPRPTPTPRPARTAPHR